MFRFFQSFMRGTLDAHGELGEEAILQGIAQVDTLRRNLIVLYQEIEQTIRACDSLLERAESPAFRVAIRDRAQVAVAPPPQTFSGEYRQRDVMPVADAEYGPGTSDTVEGPWYLKQEEPV